MFKFDFKKAAIYQAVVWKKNFLFRFATPLRRLFLLAFIVLIALFLYGFFLGDFAIAILSRFFGMLIISLALSLIFWELEFLLGILLS